MLSRFNQRSTELEHLDKGDYSAEEYEGCLVELRRINKWLGDTRALRQTLFADIYKLKLRSFSVLDVGAGSGELLRATAEWAQQSNRSCLCVGVELNARSAKAIVEESLAFPEIGAVRADGFRLPFADKTFDYGICSLITHHFSDSAVVEFLRELSRIARRAVFAIDLNRAPLAYYFYTTVGRLFLHNRLIREDGALSILRSFKPDEFKTLGQQAGLSAVKVIKTFPSRLVLTGVPQTVEVPSFQSRRNPQSVTLGASAGALR